MVAPQEVKNETQNPHVYEFGEFHIDRAERLLKRAETTIHLPPKVIDLLMVLVESGGRILSKEELMTAVWSDSFVEETNLTHNISLLRRTLGEKNNGAKFIETIPRRGYRFVADVRRARDESEYELIAVERTDTQILIEEECESDFEIPALSAPRGAGGRRKAIFVAASVVAGLLIAAAAGYWFFGRGGQVPVKSFQISGIRRVTSNGSATMSSISPDGKFVAYVVENNRRHSLWLRNISTESDIIVFADSTAPIKSVKFGPDERIYFVVSDVLYYVPMLGGPVQRVLDVAGGLASQIFTFSPDGKQIAFMRITEESRDSSIMLAESDGKNERLLAVTRHPQVFAWAPVWSPDGAVIAMPMILEENFGIGVIRVSDGAVSLIPAPKWSFIQQAEWLPDSRSLLALVEDGEIWRVSYPDGASEKLSDDLNRFSSISLSRDGESLIATKQEQDGHLWILPLEAGSSARQLTQGFAKSDGGMGLDWLSNDMIRFETGPAGQSFNIDIEGRNATKTVSVPTAMSTLSPDKKFLAFQHRDENGFGVFRIDIANGELRRLASAVPVWARFSPDGKWIVYTHYRDDISIWRVSSDGGEPQQVTRLPGYAHCPVVSPDGARLAFVWWESPKSDAPAKIAVVSFNDGKIITALSAPIQEQLKAGAFSKETIEWTPDGRAIDYIQLRNGVSNIWRQPLDGSAAAQITFFETGRIANFAYSPDRKHLALARGNFASDVFLMKTSK